MSPNQYHLEVKIEKAKELLTITDLSIKEIASDLGYDNQNYFSNLFSKRVGCSPSSFREER
jgi:AraC-like DNA-binding protein